MSAAEEWRPVPGWEGRYEVSDHGRVRSLTSTGRARAPRKPAVGKDDRLYVPLWRDDECTNYPVHRLVAMAFCEPRPGGVLVRHLDGNHRRNVPGNLAWGTSSENNRDTVRHGRNRNAGKTHCDSGHEYTPENTISKATGRNCRKCTYASNRRSKAKAQGGSRG